MQNAEPVDAAPSASKRFSQNIRKTTTDSLKDNLKNCIENDMRNGKELSEALKKVSEIGLKTN